MTKFNEDYYLRGKETGVSNYENYSWLEKPTLDMAKVLENQLQLRASDTIMDYGCARGYLVHALRLHGFHAYGYDISEWAIENCHPQVKGCVHNTFVGKYDWVFSKDVLEHIYELDEALNDIFAAANKGTFFIVPCTDDKGKYLYPADELDKTHVHRFTAQHWLRRITPIAQVYGFSTYISMEVPTLKASVAAYPGSTAYIMCKKV